MVAPNPTHLHCLCRRFMSDGTGRSGIHRCFSSRRPPSSSTSPSPIPSSIHSTQAAAAAASWGEQRGRRLLGNGGDKSNEADEGGRGKRGPTAHLHERPGVDGRSGGGTSGGEAGRAVPPGAKQRGTSTAMVERRGAPLSG